MGVDTTTGELDLKVLGGEPTFIDYNNHLTSHGTKIAGLISAATNNAEGIPALAPRAIILPMKLNVTAVTSSGQPITEFASVVKAIRSLRFELKHGKWTFDVPVVNCSFSNNGTPPGIPRKMAQGRNISRDVKKNNRFYVASAGNDGLNVEKFPAAYEKVLGVSGLTVVLDSDESQGMYYDIVSVMHDLSGQGSSNYNTDEDVYPISGIYRCRYSVNEARGFSTITYPGMYLTYYGGFDGTSAAAPCVAALAFHLFDKNQSADWTEVYARIVNTRNDAFSVANPPLAGLVDFAAALDGWQ